MRAVRAKDTAPELVVRRLVHRLGYRYRLHRRALPGTPDLVFAMRRCVIFVHGCFWHGHEDCSRSSLPKTNVSFWKEKLGRNRERDSAHVRALEAAGWRVMIVWECETKDPLRLEAVLSEFLTAAP